MSETPQKILELIQKLIAHAESAQAIGNEDEALAFTAKFQELLTKYKLSKEEVMRASGEKEVYEEISVQYVSWRDLGLEERKVPVWWTEMLARMVAQAYYVEFVACRGLKMKLTAKTYGLIGFFIGEETDRRLAVWMYCYLARFLDREATRSYNQAWKDYKRVGLAVYKLRGYRKGWMEGFLVRLKQRLDEEFRPETQAGSTAIVLRTNALARIGAWIKESEPNINDEGKTPKAPDGSAEGFVGGFQAADEVDLKRKALDQASTTQKQLSR